MLVHRIQGHFTPMENVSLQAWLQQWCEKPYGKGKRGAWVLSGPVSDLKGSLNGMPRMLSPKPTGGYHRILSRGRRGQVLF